MMMFGSSWVRPTQQPSTPDTTPTKPPRDRMISLDGSTCTCSTLSSKSSSSLDDGAETMLVTPDRQNSKSILDSVETLDVDSDSDDESRTQDDEERGEALVDRAPLSPPPATSTQEPEIQPQCEPGDTSREDLTMQTEVTEDDADADQYDSANSSSATMGPKVPHSSPNVAATTTPAPTPFASKTSTSGSSSSVSFHSHVKVLEFPILMGDAIPSSGGGVPLTIGWEVSSTYEHPLQPVGRKRGTQLLIPRKQRAQMLVARGYTMREINTRILECEAVQTQREISANSSRVWDALQLMVISARKRLGSALRQPRSPSVDSAPRRGRLTSTDSFTIQSPPQQQTPSRRRLLSADSANELEKPTRGSRRRLLSADSVSEVKPLTIPRLLFFSSCRNKEEDNDNDPLAKDAVMEAPSASSPRSAMSFPEYEKEPWEQDEEEHQDVELY